MTSRLNFIAHCALLLTLLCHTVPTSAQQQHQPSAFQVEHSHTDFRNDRASAYSSDADREAPPSARSSPNSRASASVGNNHQQNGGSSAPFDNYQQDVTAGGGAQSAAQSALHRGGGGEGQQSRQRCEELVRHKLGGYDRQTFRSTFVRGDIEESQRGVFLCCVKQYFDQVANTFSYDCASELEKLSENADSSDRSQQSTADPFAQEVTQSPSSGRSSSSNGQSDDQQARRSQLQPLPQQQQQQPYQGGDSAQNQAAPSQSMQPSYSPPSAYTPSQQPLPVPTQADAFARQISSPQFVSPYGQPFFGSSAFAGPSGLSVRFGPNPQYGSTAGGQPGQTAAYYAPPQFSFSYASPQGYANPPAGAPSLASSFYPSSSDVFGTAPAGVDIVGTSNNGQLTFYGPQGNVLGSSSSANADNGQSAEVQQQQPSRQRSLGSPQVRQLTSENSGDNNNFGFADTVDQSSNQRRQQPPSNSLQTIYSPEPDRQPFSASSTGVQNLPPPSPARRASSTTLLYSPLQTQQQIAGAARQQPGAAASGSSGVSISNVDGRISGFVYGPQGVQRLDDSNPLGQQQFAASRPNAFTQTSSQQQSGSGSPYMSSSSQSFQTVNGEGVALFNNNGNQRAYRVTTSGLQPIQLTPAHQQQQRQAAAVNSGNFRPEQQHAFQGSSGRNAQQRPSLTGTSSSASLRNDIDRIPPQQVSSTVQRSEELSGPTSGGRQRSDADVNQQHGGAQSNHQVANDGAAFRRPGFLGGALGGGQQGSA